MGRQEFVQGLLGCVKSYYRPAATNHGLWRCDSDNCVSTDELRDIRDPTVIIVEIEYRIEVGCFDWFRPVGYTA